MNSIMNRRSTRRFTEQAVEKEKIERILRAAMQAPTGHNAQEWEFLVVQDKETILRVSEASPVTVAAKNAGTLIIPLFNAKRRHSENHEDLWVADLAAATENILIQVEEEGLGAVWLSVWPYQPKMEYLSRLFDLPEHIVPFCVIPIGYKQKEKEFDDRYDPEKIHWEKY